MAPELEVARKWRTHISVRHIDLTEKYKKNFHVPSECFSGYYFYVILSVYPHRAGRKVSLTTVGIELATYHSFSGCCISYAQFCLRWQQPFDTIFTPAWAFSPGHCFMVHDLQKNRLRSRIQTKLSICCFICGRTQGMKVSILISRPTSVANSCFGNKSAES